jgi:hypothetical protein
MSIFISGFGSDSNTSNPAKATVPLSKNSIRATSSKAFPLAVLIMPTPFFNNPNAFLSIQY